MYGPYYKWRYSSQRHVSLPEGKPLRSASTQHLGEYWGITGNYFNPIIGRKEMGGYFQPYKWRPTSFAKVYGGGWPYRNEWFVGLDLRCSGARCLQRFDKKSPTVGPTERTPKKPEYLRTPTQVFVRGPLGFGPIQFLMDSFFWGGQWWNENRSWIWKTTHFAFLSFCFFCTIFNEFFKMVKKYSKFWKIKPLTGVSQIHQFLWCLVGLEGNGGTKEMGWIWITTHVFFVSKKRRSPTTHRIHVWYIYHATFSWIRWLM